MSHLDLGLNLSQWAKSDNSYWKKILSDFCEHKEGVSIIVAPTLSSKSYDYLLSLTPQNLSQTESVSQFIFTESMG